jgi:hypothetical protein
MAKGKTREPDVFDEAIAAQQQPAEPNPVEEPKKHLPVNTSHTAAEAAFLATIDDSQRLPPPMVQTVTINHALRKFMVNGEPVDYIDAFPAYYFQLRGWWPKGWQPGAHDLPECYSNNMKFAADQATNKQGPLISIPLRDASGELTGETITGHSCQKCKWAQFGSHPQGKGQACKTTTLLFLCQPEDPDNKFKVIILPPSSIKSLMGSGGRFPKPGYLETVRNMKDPETGHKTKVPQLAWTRFTMKEAAVGSLHAILEPTFLKALVDAQGAQALANMINGYKEVFESFRGDITNISGEDDD